jgi:hypothetical protein
MVENGLEYSHLTTGEAFVFLQIKEAVPHTLYYHLAEPNTEAEAQDEIDILLCRTVVSQASLDSKPRSQKWRNQTLETASRATIDHETVLRQIPAEEKALTPPASVFQARIHPFQRSPIMLRPRKSRKASNGCGSIDIKVHEDSQSPSGSSDDSSAAGSILRCASDIVVQESLVMPTVSAAVALSTAERRQRRLSSGSQATEMIPALPPYAFPCHVSSTCVKDRRIAW